MHACVCVCVSVLVVSGILYNSYMYPAVHFYFLIMLMHFLYY